MSLQTAALLATLRLGSFAPKRKDKRVTADVLLRHHVHNKDLGAWSTTLLPAHATDPIKAIASKIRKVHATTTLTWDREGTGLLPGMKYFDYMREIAALKAEWQKKVDHFVSHYPSYLAEARTTLNGLFNPDLYPDPSRVREKFEFNVALEPIPAAGDFRIALSQSERTRLEEQLEERLREATRTAQADLLKRIAEPVTRLLNTLAQPDKAVRQPTLSSLEAVLATVDAYNVTSDPAITTLRDEVRASLTTFTADQMNHDPVLRSAAAEKADAILAKMSGWLTSP